MPRIDNFFFRLPFFHLLTEKNARLLYVLRAVRDLLNKVTFFFLPVFLFQLGGDIAWLDQFGLNDIQKGMIVIASFYGLNRFVIFFAAIPAGKIIRKLGLTKSLTYSYLLRIGVFASLYFAYTYPVLVLVAAIFEALQSNFFWNSFFTMLTDTITSRKAGSEIGTLYFMMQLMAILSPAISGYIAYQYGFEVLFLIGLLLTVFSLIVIVNMDEIFINDAVSWKEFKKWLSEKTFIRLTGSFVGRYINDMVLFLWPLYIFLVLGSVDRVGFLYSFSLFLALILTFFIDNYLDKHKKNKKPFFFSGSALSVLWLVRISPLSVWGIALVDTFERLFSNFHWLYYDWIFIKRGKGGQAFSYFVYREMVISVGAVFFWLSFAIFFSLTGSWTGVFVFGAIGVLLSLLIREHHHEQKPLK